MSGKEEAILNAIEYSMFMYPGVTGVMEEYLTDSLKGYVCVKVDNELYNRVGMARLSEDQVDQTIKEVITHFTSKGIKNIGWNISPLSKPENIGERLIEFNFEEQQPDLGMVKSMSDELNIDITDEFLFKKYENEKAVNMYKDPEIQAILEKSFGLPKGGAQIFGLISDSFLNVGVILYVAYDKDSGLPIAYSSMSTVPNTKFNILNGAATLPNYRKRGIYSAMLKLRYGQAEKNGIEQLIIHAAEKTSAPIAVKNGFKQLCVLPKYVWRAK